MHSHHTSCSSQPPPCEPTTLPACPPPPPPHRRCRWVSLRAAWRMAPPQMMQRFERDTRGAEEVEPNVQEQWKQVGVGYF